VLVYSSLFHESISSSTSKRGASNRATGHAKRILPRGVISRCSIPAHCDAYSSRVSPFARSLNDSRRAATFARHCHSDSRTNRRSDRAFSAPYRERAREREREGEGEREGESEKFVAKSRLLSKALKSGARNARREAAR